MVSMNNTVIKKGVFIVILLLLWGVLLSVVIRDHSQELLARFSSGSKIPATVLHFDIELLNAPPGLQRGSFYFDTGRGFNPSEVVVVPYTQIADKIAKHYSVMLPTRKKIRRLRFDPLDGKGELILKNMTVQCYKTKEVAFSQELLTSQKNKAIESITVQGKAVTISSIAGDPYFVLVNDFSPYQKK